MEVQKKIFNFNLEIKEDDTSDGNYGYFKGYANAFDVVDSYNDVVVKGAFVKGIKKLKSDGIEKLPMLLNHNMGNVIGGFLVKTLKEDETGLYCEGEINLKIKDGINSYNLIKQGVLKTMSIGYQAKTVSFKEINKVECRILEEIELMEISLTAFPANRKAKITECKSQFATMKFTKEDIDLEANKKEIKEFVSEYEEKNDLKKMFLCDSLEFPIVYIKNDTINYSAKALERYSEKISESIEFDDTISKNQKNEIKENINELFAKMREDLGEMAHFSPFETKAHVVEKFSIKDFDVYLLNSGLTRTALTSFYKRLGELKGKTAEKEEAEVKDTQPAVVEKAETTEAPAVEVAPVEEVKEEAKILSEIKEEDGLDPSLHLKFLLKTKGY
jgi:HK97 family phage prohead protease